MTFGVSDEKAVQVYGAVLAAGDTLLAAYTAVIDVAEEALRSSNRAAEEVQKVTKGLEQQKSLAILRDPIEDFQIVVAYEMEFAVGRQAPI